VNVDRGSEGESACEENSEKMQRGRVNVDDEIPCKGECLRGAKVEAVPRDSEMSYTVVVEALK
jgi:hypothetical protein